MASTARTTAGLLGVLIASAVLLTAPIVGSGAASAPAAEKRLEAPGITRQGAGVAPRAARPGANPGAAIPLFVLDKGRFRTIVLPFSGVAAQDVARINNRGQIVGGTRKAVFNDQGFVVGGGHRGFLRDERGRYTRFGVPGAAGTTPHDLNNRGQVVGEYTDTAGRFHGFLWDKGRFTTLDGPDGAGATATELNDLGQVIGLYLDASSTIHGYLLTKGRYTSIDAPGAAITFPFGINNRGQIVGLAQTAPGGGSNNHGFLLAKGAAGPFTPIDVPGALGGTIASGINDRGQIAGVYGNGDPASSPPAAASPRGGML